MEKTLSIIFGFSFLYLINFILLIVLLYLYLKISKRDLKYKNCIITTASLIAVLVLLLNSFSLIVFSSNGLPLYIIGSFFLLVPSNFFLLYKFKKVDKIDSAIIATSLAIIMNPVWFNLLGII